MLDAVLGLSRAAGALAGSRLAEVAYSSLEATTLAHNVHH
jgi:hypothetical protein